MADPVSQYLERYAEPEARLADALGGGWAHAVVVPVHDEPAERVAVLAEAIATQSALAVIVVNATDSASERVHQANAAVLARLAGRAGVVTIDRASVGKRLPDGQGVGLARKIGCDLALAAHVAGAIESSWIHSTDADVTLPGDYFDAAAEFPASCAAAVYRFRHDTPDDEVGRALRLYEASLRYYVMGLEFAESPYAFHTIGSAMAIRARAYAKVRGVPQRQGGEDFYLLSKLAKVGPVWRAQSQPIRIAARVSDRVPFGTGPATLKIAATLSAGERFAVYHPRSFECVGEAIRALESKRVPGRGRVGQALEALGAPHAIERARGSTRAEPAYATRMFEWFDAFRTLKLIHHVRDHGLEMVPIEQALIDAPFCPSEIDALARADEALGPGPRGATQPA